MLARDIVPIFMSFSDSRQGNDHCLYPRAPEKSGADTMKKPLTENLWLMGALTIIPMVGSFAGYRYWMRQRSKKYWLLVPPTTLYSLLTNSPPPLDRIFTPEEHEDMASKLAAQDTPFWHVNFVSEASHPSQESLAVPQVTAETPEEEPE